MTELLASVAETSNVGTTVGVLLFAAAGTGMVLAILLLGAVVRPKVYHPEKGAIYECGEPTIGSARVQFDLRYYVVALVFIVFDIEIALFYPWAVVFGGGGFEQANAQFLQQVKVAALWDMLFFFGVVVVGFLYLWKHGYLEWFRGPDVRQRSDEQSGRSG